MAQAVRNDKQELQRVCCIVEAKGTVFQGESGPLCQMLLRDSKNQTDMSTGFGNTKVAVDLDESSSSVLEVGVVVVGSQMGMR